MEVLEEISYPSIIFKLKGDLYCTNSREVATIMQVPPYESIPTSKPYLSGIFPLRGEIIQMLDLRTYFGHASLQEECERFAQMLEDRKQDHVRWVDALERAVQEGVPFTLATDPHRCAFGQWYDSYQSENSEIRFQLHKIDDPHRRLHHLALEVGQCTEKAKAEELISRARGEYMPTILTLLEELKHVFRTTVYHEMALVLSGRPLALLVDEVLSVEQLSPAIPLPASRRQSDGCITGVTHSDHQHGDILAFSVHALLRALG